MVRGGVFINYRGEDSYSYGALLHAELSRHFGAEVVFLDSESIPAGADYVAQLLGRVRQARVVLAVIGTRWLAVEGSAGGRRIDDPADWIRRELAEAFAAGVRVIPVLTDGAVMPTEAELPEDLRELGRCQFRRLRHRDAGADMERLVSDLAAADCGLSAAARRRRGVPRQLPTAPSSFIGRARELDRLSETLAAAADRGGTERAGVVVISAIAGTAGIGKTTLAVHWAHRVADRFPDGQLFANLRGFDPGGQVMDPAEAVRGFLEALGVPAHRVPTGVDAQAALYRSLLADRRVLVVLDNARDPGQVRPLLPAAAGCLVLVTSRNHLFGLVTADGAQPISLDVLTRAEAQELLARRLGVDRLEAEPDAVEEIITRCARLPLALAVVASRAASHPDFALHDFAAELGDSSGSLDVLDSGDPVTDVRAVFSWSYRALTPDAARLFRLLGLHPGPDISAAAAASLAGSSAPAVRSVLAELTRTSLVAEHTPGRYTFHDLLRAYAHQLAHRIDTDEQRQAATQRMLDHYLHTAHAAALLVSPRQQPLALRPPHPGTNPGHPADREQAFAWFTAEHSVLLAAIDDAARQGRDTHAWQLASAIGGFLYRQGHWHEWVSTGRTAVVAAGRADPSTQGDTHRRLARAYVQLGRFDDAHTHLRHALNLDRQTGDQDDHAYTHSVLAQMWGRQGRFAAALDHVRQFIDLSRATGRRADHAAGLSMLGWIQTRLGDHHEARTSCLHAIAIMRELGAYRELHAETYENLGYAYHHLGHYTESIACYHQALEWYREIGNRHGEANTLTGLGDTHQSAGDPQAAHDVWRQALDILDQFDQYPGVDQLRAKLHPANRPTPQSDPSQNTDISVATVLNR